MAINLSSTTIAENNSINDAVGTLSATDVDVGGTLTFTLVSGSGDTDNASFSIVGTELRAAEVFDFETKSSYSVRINVNDGTDDYSEAFTITVTDGIDFIETGFKFINFRNSEIYTTDDAGDTFCVSDVYPTTRNGITFGWTNGAPTDSNRSSSVDPKFAGFNGTNTGFIKFRLDLTPGTYRFRSASGIANQTISTGILVNQGNSAGEIYRVASVSVPSGSSLDAGGTVRTRADWLANNDYVEATITESFIEIERNNVILYLQTFGFEELVVPLSAAVLSNATDSGVHDGTIFAKEPEGHQIGKISSPTGAQAFSLLGSSSTYLALEDRNGSTYLVTTGTRIPDNWTDTVTIRQTTDLETKDTNFVLTATAIDRPVTGLYSDVTSRTLSERAITRAVIYAELWPGYEDQAFDSDQTATSTTDLRDKINGLTPDGTSWYRIRVQDGTWTGTAFLNKKDFGAGGLLIEPDTGHDPLIECEIDNMLLRKCHVRGLKINPWGDSAGQYTFNGGIGSAPYTLLRFSELRAGAFYAPGFDIDDWADWSDVFGFEFCEQIAIHNCEFNGVSNCVNISGGRIFSLVGNTYRQVVRDFHALTTAFRFSTPRGVFDDDITYCEIVDGTSWDKPDILSQIATVGVPHADYLQIRRTTGGGAAYPTGSAGLNGSSNVAWFPNVIGFTASENRLYEVVSVTGDGLIDPQNPPTGTGTGIVSGNVTFDYSAEYDLGTDFRVVLENNCVLADGINTNVDDSIYPDVQFVINSNNGWNNNLIISAINNMCGTKNIRGIVAGSDSEVYAEKNTFVGPAEKPLQNDQAIISGGLVWASRNIVGVADSAPNVESNLGVLMSENNVGVNFRSGAVSPFLPNEVLIGTFTLQGSVGWVYPITDDDTVDATEFRADMQGQLTHKAGTAGATITPLANNDVTAPTLESITIQSSGTTASLQFSEPVTGTTVPVFSTAGIVATYVSGSGSDELTYSLSRIAYSTDTLTASLAGAAILDDSDNALVDVTGFSVTNNSTQPEPDVTAPTLSSPTISITGTTATLSVSTNEANGLIYYLLKAGSAPSDGEILSASQTVAPGSTGVISLGSETVLYETTYHLGVFQLDAAFNQSATVTTSETSGSEPSSVDTEAIIEAIEAATAAILATTSKAAIREALAGRWTNLGTGADFDDIEIGDTP